MKEASSLYNPVRKIGKNHTSLTGKTTSVATKELKSFESSLERDFIHLTNFNPNVERFIEQPLSIEYFDEDCGKPRKYTPDFLIFYKNDGVIKDLPALLVEIKHKESIKKEWPDCKKKYKAAMRYCDSKGWRFQIITEDQIRTEFLFNAKFLQNYLDPSRVNMEDVQFIIDTMYSSDESTPCDLLNNMVADNDLSRGKYLYTLWHMIAVQMIHVDMSQRLNMKSLIWIEK